MVIPIVASMSDVYRGIDQAWSPDNPSNFDNRSREIGALGMMNNLLVLPSCAGCGETPDNKVCLSMSCQFQ
jgi:hypothetical protein